MRHSRRWLSSLILVFLICVAVGSAQAQDAELVDVIVTNNRDDLLLYLSVDGAFRDEMKEAILSGVPTTFSFVMALYRVRDFWLDKKVAVHRVTHSIKYDNLKKQFTVSRSWEREPQVTQSFSEAQKLMTEVDSFKMIELAHLEKGRQYQIRAKAELSKKTLPLNLHYVLFFMSLWDFETDWYAVDFIY